MCVCRLLRLLIGVHQFHRIHKTRVKVPPPSEPKFAKMRERGGGLCLLDCFHRSPRCIWYFNTSLLIFAATHSRSAAAQMANAYIFSRFPSKRWKLLAESYGQRQIENLLRDGYSLCFPAFFLALLLWCKNYILPVVCENGAQKAASPRQRKVWANIVKVHKKERERRRERKNTRQIINPCERQARTRSR